MGDTDYPPMQECNEKDVNSFVGINLDLRAIPELSRETTQNLSPVALARLVASIRKFQSNHLGMSAQRNSEKTRRKSTSKGSTAGASSEKGSTMVRLPDHIFVDRERGGALHTALFSAFRFKASQKWRSFDLSEKSNDEIIAMLRKMEQDLISSGHLSRPTFYFDKSIPPKKRSKLESLALEYGGSVTEDYIRSTHIVAYDDEMDSKTEVANEIKKEKAGIVPDRTYLRTLSVVEKGVDRNTVPMALVHWWFWPTSYDEWIPAEDVNGVADEDPPERGPGGAWVVSCKFLRDVKRFNEWGLEIDYVIENFKQKLALYDDSLGFHSSETTSAEGKKSDTSKKSKSNQSTSKTDPSSKSLSGTSLSIKRDRTRGNGMNPRSLNTGERGPKGRGKITVFDGALRIPDIASEVMQNFFSEQNMPSVVYEYPNSKKNETKEADETKKYFPFYMPSCEVLPLSMDTSYLSMDVTEISKVSNATNNKHEGKVLSATVAKNKRLYLKRKSPSSFCDTVSGDNLRRIRGGGVDEIEQAAKANAGAQTAVKVNALATQSEATTPSISTPSSQVPGSTNTILAQPRKPNEISSGAADTKTQTMQQSHVNPSLLSKRLHPAQYNKNIATVPAPKPTAATTTTTTTATTTQKTTISTAPLGSIYNPNTVHALPGSSHSVSTSQHTISQNSNPNNTEQVDSSTVTTPPWYNPKSVSSFEKTMLPEWFDSSAPHRTSSSYQSIREGVIRMGKLSPNKYITTASVRKKFPGDIGSLLRLHMFLVSWGFINGNAIGDSMPVVYSRLTEPQQKNFDTMKMQAKQSSQQHPSIITKKWDPNERAKLTKAVVKHARKKRKLCSNEDGGDSPIGVEEYNIEIDWEGVASDVGSGFSPGACQLEFMSTPLVEEDNEEDKKMPSSETQQKIKKEEKTEETKPEKVTTKKPEELKQQAAFHDVVMNTRPEIMKAAFNAALSASCKASSGENTEPSLQNIVEAKNAAMLAGVALKGMEKAKEEEGALNKILLEILDQRMLKLENRLSLFDDVEHLLDTERLALELERRDLYTARCRYWLGNGSGLG